MDSAALRCRLPQSQWIRMPTGQCAGQCVTSCSLHSGQTDLRQTASSTSGGTTAVIAPVEVLQWQLSLWGTLQRNDGPHSNVILYSTVLPTVPVHSSRWPLWRFPGATSTGLADEHRPPSQYVQRCPNGLGTAPSDAKCTSKQIIGESVN